MPIRAEAGHLAHESASRANAIHEGLIGLISNSRLLWAVNAAPHATFLSVSAPRQVPPEREEVLTTSTPADPGWARDPSV